MGGAGRMGVGILGEWEWGYWEDEEDTGRMRMGYWEDGDEDTGDTGRMRTLGGRRGCLRPWGRTASPSLSPHGPTVTPCPPAGPRGRGGATWRSARWQRTGGCPPARAGERPAPRFGARGGRAGGDRGEEHLKHPPNLAAKAPKPHFCGRFDQIGEIWRVWRGLLLGRAGSSGVPAYPKRQQPPCPKIPWGFRAAPCPWRSP